MLICSFFLLMLLIVAIVGLLQIEKVGHSLKEVSVIHLPAVRQMSLIDMYHDSLSGLVYKTLFGIEVKDQQLIKSAAEEFAENSEKMQKLLNQLNALPLSPSTKEEIQLATPAIDKYISSARQVLKLASEGKKDEAILLLPDFNEAFSFLEERLEKLGDRIEKDSEHAKSEGLVTAEKGEFYSIVAIVISILLGLTAMWLVVGKLMDGITQTVEALSGGVHDLQNSSQKMNMVSQRLTRSVETQVTSITQSVTAMDEISAMIKNNDHSATHASKLSVSTKQSAESGKMTVEKMKKEIDEISLSYDEIKKWMIT